MTGTAREAHAESRREPVSVPFGEPITEPMTAPMAEPDTGVRRFALRPFRRMRLATQLAILGATVIAVVVAGSFAALESRLRATTRAHLTREIARTQRTLLQLERRELAGLLGTALLVGEATSMRYAMETYRTEDRTSAAREQARRTLQRMVEEQFLGVEADLLLITDVDGNVLAAGARQAAVPRPGEPLGSVPAVRHALDAEAAIDTGNVGVARLADAHYTVAVAPVVLDGYTVGTVLLGERIDQAWVRTLHAALGGEIVARAGMRVLATTFDGDSVAALLPGGPRAVVGDSARTLRLAGEDWVAAPLTLGVAQAGEPVTLWMLQSVERSVRNITGTFARDFLLFGLVALVLAGAGAALAARTVLAPLTHVVTLLRDGARTGVFGRALTPVMAPREIRWLSHSYTQLVTALAGERDAVRRRTAELESANADLTLQVRERVRVEQELHEREEQLRQAQKLEALGTLAGGVAHDFNNLLTVISGFTELALGSMPKDDRTRADLLQVKDAAHRAGELTTQLLAFGRRQMLQPRVVDLNESVERIHAMLGRLVGSHLTIRIDVARDLARVHADPGQLEQVLMNLALNARDAMPEGGTLTIGTRNVTDGVALVVRDTGHGMDAATKARIFEPFFTTKGHGKGTGLGLATVYGIVQQSGGRIQVESAPGAGTTFTIVLPAVPASGADAAGTIAGGVVPRGAEVVLLAEDEPQVRELAARILADLGYVVLEASDGREALKTAERHPGIIDLLLTDIVMPRMTGRELARRLRLARPETRVLYMSGHSEDAVALHGESVRGSGFIRKPFSPESLGRAVRDVLDAEALGVVA